MIFFQLSTKILVTPKHSLFAENDHFSPSLFPNKLILTVQKNSKKKLRVTWLYNIWTLPNWGMISGSHITSVGHSMELLAGITSYSLLSSHPQAVLGQSRVLCLAVSCAGQVLNSIYGNFSHSCGKHIVLKEPDTITGCPQNSMNGKYLELVLNTCLSSSHQSVFDLLTI